MNIKPVVNAPHWQDFIEWVKELEGRDITNLSSSSDPVEIYRYQGKLAVYKLLYGLKENTNVSK